MQDGQVSGTALLVAEQRAAHQVFDRPLVFEDPVAVPILGAGKADALRRDEAKYRTAFGLALRAAMVGRARYFEDELATALARGVRQVAILGAGLDTLAYRHIVPDDCTIFEVDSPATQDWKRHSLQAAGIAVPASLRFVPIDFGQVAVTDGLREGGVDLGRPVFLSWLGVTYYLDADTVGSTLRDLGRLAGGSGLVFDYFEPTQDVPPALRPGFQALAEQVAAEGEPWKTVFAPSDMGARLRASGFADVEDLDSAAMAARYFAGRSDGLATAGPIRFVRALIG